MDTILQGPRVSFFELYACERFKGMFKSAMYYTLNILLNRNDSIIPLRYFKDEIIVTSEIILQSFYLKKFGATFFEYFYNITRKKNKMPLNRNH